MCILLYQVQHAATRNKTPHFKATRSFKRALLSPLSSSPRYLRETLQVVQRALPVARPCPSSASPRCLDRHSSSSSSVEKRCLIMTTRTQAHAPNYEPIAHGSYSHQCNNKRGKYITSLPVVHRLSTPDCRALVLSPKALSQSWRYRVSICSRQNYS